MMWVEHGEYEVDINSEIVNDGYEFDHTTKDGKNCRIVGAKFNSIKKGQGFCDVQVYAVEAFLENSKVFDILIVYPNSLVKIKESGDATTVKSRMEEVSRLHVQIMLNEGRFGHQDPVRIESTPMLADQIQQLKSKLN